jgi:alkylation response protein AidB-like acyl-CoA dehydrogenase
MFNLKVAVSEDVQNCADEGIQIYGGMGFWIQWKVPDRRIYEGTNQNAIC